MYVYRLFYYFMARPSVEALRIGGQSAKHRSDLGPR